MIRIETSQAILKNGFREFYVCVKDKDGCVIEREMERHRDKDMSVQDTVWRHIGMLERLWQRMSDG